MASNERGNEQIGDKIQKKGAERRRVSLYRGAGLQCDKKRRQKKEKKKTVHSYAPVWKLMVAKAKDLKRHENADGRMGVQALKLKLVWPQTLEVGGKK